MNHLVKHLLDIDHLAGFQKIYVDPQKLGGRPKDKLSAKVKAKVKANAKAKATAEVKAKAKALYCKLWEVILGTFASQ